MNKLFSASNLILFYLFIILFSVTIVLASNTVSFSPSISFEYNLLSTVAEGTTIDTNAQTKLRFNIYEYIDEVYCNGRLVDIDYSTNSFEIDLTGMHGKTTFTFRDANNTKIQFTYYLSNKKGLLEGYELVKGKKIKAYITTYNGIRIIYTNPEKGSLGDLIKYIDDLPENLLENVDTIKMIPYENSSNIAGVTKENVITLYKFSKYSKQTQKNILIHEIAHTWANKLISENKIDYLFTDYTNAVSLDKNIVSHYARRFTEKTGRTSEDFAESVAFYFINPAFSKMYPNRSVYIQNLLAI